EDEAELIEAAGTPFCACHHEEHESMLRLCDQAYLLSDSNGRGARALLRATLPRLMRRHIVGMDQIAVFIIHSAVGRHAILESEPLEPAGDQGRQSAGQARVSAGPTGFFRAAKQAVAAGTGSAFASRRRPRPGFASIGQPIGVREPDLAAPADRRGTLAVV